MYVYLYIERELATAVYGSEVALAQKDNEASLQRRRRC